MKLKSSIHHYIANQAEVFGGAIYTTGLGAVSASAVIFNENKASATSLWTAHDDGAEGTLHLTQIID